VQMLGGPDWDRDPERLAARAQLPSREGWLRVPEESGYGARADVQMVTESVVTSTTSQKLLPPHKEPWRPWKVPAWRIILAVMLFAFLVRRFAQPSIVASRFLASLAYPPGWSSEQAARELSSGILELTPAVFVLPERSGDPEMASRTSPATSVEAAAREVAELCRNEESTGCDTALLAALHSFRSAKAKGYKWPSLNDVASLCRDEESSGCDVDLMRALTVLESRRAQGTPSGTPFSDSELEELCRDPESSGCDLDMLDALVKLDGVQHQGRVPTLAEIQEMCRDDESSGCDADMLDLLSALELPDGPRADRRSAKAARGGPRARLVDGLRHAWARVRERRTQIPEVMGFGEPSAWVRLRPH